MKLRIQASGPFSTVRGLRHIFEGAISSTCPSVAFKGGIWLSRGLSDRGEKLVRIEGLKIDYVIIRLCGAVTPGKDETTWYDSISCLARVHCFFRSIVFEGSGR